MSPEEFCKAVEDDNDAVELTRLALLFGRARADEYARAVANDADRKLAWLDRDLARELARSGLTLRLSRPTRTALVVLLRRAFSEYPGHEAYAVHRFALALEQVFDSRFYHHLAAFGPRDLKPTDLLAEPMHFASSTSAFRQHYGSNLAPAPVNTGGRDRPDRLQRAARLVPAAPHTVLLRWVPDWTTLDELTPASRVAVVIPAAFEDIAIPQAVKNEENGRWFGVAPKNPERVKKAALELIDRADSHGAEVVVLPELCMTREGIDAVAAWVETEARNVRIAICGSCHEETQEGRRNTTMIASGRGAHPRIVQAKVVPFTTKAGAEDIRHPDPVVHVLASRRWSVTPLICKDVIDERLQEFVAALAPAMVLVPAFSETTGPIEVAAMRLALAAQTHLVAANLGHPPKAGHVAPPTAIMGRPMRVANQMVQKYADSHAPVAVVTGLGGGPWDRLL